MLDRSRGREIPGRPSLPRPLPKPSRNLNPRLRKMRDGHRREIDPSRDRQTYQDRLDRALVDVGLYRAVSFATWPKPISTATPTSLEGLSTSGSAPAPCASTRSMVPRATPTSCSLLLRPARNSPAARPSTTASTPDSGPGPAWSSPANSPTTPRSTERPGRRSSASSPTKPLSAASGSMPN